MKQNIMIGLINILLLVGVLIMIVPVFFPVLICLEVCMVLFLILVITVLVNRKVVIICVFVLVVDVLIDVVVLVVLCLAVELIFNSLLTTLKSCVSLFIVKTLRFSVASATEFINRNGVFFMVCFHPLKGYRARFVNPETNKRPIVFSPSQGYPDLPVVVPCGKCIGCLLSRSFFWSVRCVCESVFYQESYFLTLTYDRDHLPDDGELNRSHVQNFVKRLRYYFRDYKLRVFYCGEYGEKRHRPHYHMIVFGLPLKKESIYMFPFDSSKRGNVNYACPFLESIWKQGIVRVGSFSSSSAAYVAQYTLKKNSFRMASFLKNKIVKPFIGASNRPGLGYDFFMKYHTEIYRRKFFHPIPNSDVIVHRVPYFDKLLEKYFKIEWFKYVELPRRRRMALNMRLYREAGINSDSVYNPLFDRDSEMLYYKERKLLRSLKARDDF